jgi:deferrochelatase/peroxidase EfeB
MSGIDRRTLLRRSALVLGAAGIGAAGEAAIASASEPAPPPAAGSVLDERVPFDGPHQAGILTPPPDHATYVALDSIAAGREDLLEALRQLSARARSLSQGDNVGVVEDDEPPPDSGVLGEVNSPDRLTVTIAFGASLFDDRYGLARLKPRTLIEMPNFPNDDIDPARAGGDVLLQVCAAHRDTVVHTVRELMRVVAGRLTIRWTIDGFRSADRGPTKRSTTRNLFAFRDGTANPPSDDAALMDKLIWVPRGGTEPAWAAGGTYQVVRTIRMHVEFWDRVGMREQQAMIGRHRVSGAPLGGTDEFEDPRLDLDPKGERIALDSHMRLANPRTPATDDQRIIRRGYNFHRGADGAGNLDQGLVFVAFNQDIERQFATIQNRLSEEPMVDYITAVGGGYFFAPAGARDDSDWVGSGLSS